MTLEAYHVDLLRRFSLPTPEQIAPSPGCIELRDMGYLSIERAPKYGYLIATTPAGRTALEAHLAAAADDPSRTSGEPSFDGPS